MINFLKITQRLSIALTTTVALAGALSFTACQDEEFGVDSETMRRSVYDKAFIETFGKPAPGHQWGFNIAEAMMNGEWSSSKTRGSNDLNPNELNGGEMGLVWKQDGTRYIDNNNYRPDDLFGRPKNITEREHNEVYAWFTNHKVYWVNTPTNTTLNAAGSRETQDGGTKIVAHIVNSANPNYGSLTWDENKAFNHLEGNYVDDNNLKFYNGFIQHVAADETIETAKNGTSEYNGKNMDHLAFGYLGDLTKYIHLNDYNGSNGYGWGNQSPTQSNGDQNAILVFNAKFDMVTYGSSIDGSNRHNKYYIVHLKGADYDGYYLGMDLEGYDKAGEESGSLNMVLPADGICNDWIIKIGDAGASIYNPTRIMCEDLGARDFDYNDIVIDVKAANNSTDITIIVQAAGGTIPIGLYYNDTQLTKNGEGEIHTLFGSAVSTPVNVGSKGDTKNPIKFMLKFNSAKQDETYQDPDQGYASFKYDYYSTGSFNLQDIQIKVLHETNAEWTTLTNIDGDAPLKICVPNTVKWTVENGFIEDAYSGFRTWVGNPTQEFWNTSINNNTINNSLLISK